MTGGSAQKALRLLAMDGDDLEVISAALQDAVMRVRDISWERGAGRLTIALNRLRWEMAEPPDERIRAAIQLGCVLAVKSRNLRTAAQDDVLQLLAVTFDPGEAPGGTVTFAFAEGGDLSAEVECIDAALADVSEPWTPVHAPEHDQSES